MAIFHDNLDTKGANVCAYAALNDSAHVDTLAGFGRSHSSVTTITFMYNGGFRVCHAGHLLMRLNFLLTSPNAPGFAQR
jgi:hypothetical protein